MISFGFIASLPKLTGLGIVKKTRRVGKADMYKLNEENPTAKVLMLFHWNIIKSAYKELSLGKIDIQKIKIPA